MHLAAPEFAGIVDVELLPVYVSVVPLNPVVYVTPVRFPVCAFPPYELLIKVGSATSCAIFLAL